MATVQPPPAAPIPVPAAAAAAHAPPLGLAPEDTDAEDIHDMAEPAFDHHAFPELIDAILEYAPSESLLVFRATDRHYRARVDDMLFEHVIVAPTTGTGANAAPPRRGLLGFDLRACRPPYHRLPLLPYDPADEFDQWVLHGGQGARPVSASPASQIREDCREDIARRIRVVDLHGRPPTVPFPFSEAFRDLEILRRPAVWCSHETIAFAPTVVDFIDLGRRATGMPANGKLHLDPGGGVTRHVVHVAFVPGGGDTAYSGLSFEAPAPEEKRELVLVFSTGKAAPSAPATSDTTVKLSDKDVFWQLSALARSTMLSGGTVTYVGLDAVDLGADTSEDVGSKFEKHLAESLGAPKSLGARETIPEGEAVFSIATAHECNEAALEEAMTRVAFVGFDEWCASLPEESVEFEAEWPQYNGE